MQLQSGNIVLRKPRPEDIQDRLKLGKDEDLVQFQGGNPNSFRQPTLKSVEVWYERARSEAHSWVIDVADRYVGTTRLHSLNVQDRRARYAISIQDASRRNQGIGTSVSNAKHTFSTGDGITTS